MSDRDIGAEILEGLNEIKEFEKGNADLTTRQLSLALLRMTHQRHGRLRR